MKLDGPNFLTADQKVWMWIVATLICMACCVALVWLGVIDDRS